MGAELLVLRVRDFRGIDDFRWVLENETGAFLADHAVAIDRTHDYFRALFDLWEYLNYVAGSAATVEDERRLLDDFGTWLGKEVLGAVGVRIAREAPVSVRVVLPPAAEELVAIPLELANAGRGHFVTQSIAFEYEIEGEHTAQAAAAKDEVRILALFSLPHASSPLNLRRERQMLRALVQGMRGAGGKAVTLRILQYGTTRESVRTALSHGDGWSIIHFSGHGSPGALILERADGTRDAVSSAEMAELIRKSRARPALITLSACLSAAATIQRTLKSLEIHRLPDGAGADNAADEQDPSLSVARALVRRLNCAVFAMRYPVEDEFAAELAVALYENLLEYQQSLPDAMSNAIATATERAPRTGSLSLAAPVLFGGNAATLRFTPVPLSSPQPEPFGLAYLPDEPEHFVGRVAIMSQASAALARKSKHSGILFYGMAGGGKTTCAVELAYHHEAADRFRHFAWYSAPKEGDDIELALHDFAVRMDNQLADVLTDFTFVHLIEDVKELRSKLPRFTEFLQRNAVFIILDNVESLLTAEGAWRDERWKLLISALGVSGGLSRFALTSRIRPQDLSDSVAAFQINTLQLNEAVLLVRELPNLKRLLDGTAPGISHLYGQTLVRRTLKIVQGHPKLLVLADGLARDPKSLEARLDSAGSAHDSQTLDAFFQAGETRYDAEHFLDELHRWTSGILATLPAAAQTFFSFLCALEESDRERAVIDVNWNDVWQRLEYGGPAPPIADVLRPLAEAALVEVQERPETATYRVRIHPGILEQGRSQSAAELRAAVDHEISTFWVAAMLDARKGLDENPDAAALLIARAGFASLPYLSRVNEWSMAASMLQTGLSVERSPRSLMAILPLVRKMVDSAKGGTGERSLRLLLAQVLGSLRRFDEAQSILQEIRAGAVAADDFGAAASACGRLSTILRDQGRYEPALQAADNCLAYVKLANLGPWSQLASEASRLSLLLLLGREHDAFQEIDAAVERMRTLEAPPGPNDFVDAGEVREYILQLGRSAARKLRLWEKVIAFIDESIASKMERGTTDLERAQVRYNAVEPLTFLGRVPEALDVLATCRAVAESYGDSHFLSMIWTAYGVLETQMGHVHRATEFDMRALRYDYAARNATGVRILHHNLAIDHEDGGNELRLSLAHRTASALVALATGEMVETSVQRLGRAVSAHGDAAEAALPSSFADLCATLYESADVSLASLLNGLLPPDTDRDHMLRDLLMLANEAS